MTWRRRMRRRLLWAGVLLGLVFLLGTVTALRAAAWVGRHLPRLTPIRKEQAMFRPTFVAVLAAIAALSLAAPALADNWAADRYQEASPNAALEARERALVEKRVLPSRPDWIERLAAAHMRMQPVDDRFRIAPTAGASLSPASTSSEIEWAQIGIGLALGLSFGLGLFLVARAVQARPPVAR